MYAFLLNPPKKKKKGKRKRRRSGSGFLRRGPTRRKRRKVKGKRRKGRKRKKLTKKQRAARRRASSRRGARTRSRRQCAAITKSSLHRVVCGPQKRYRSLRKRMCVKAAPKKARAAAPSYASRSATSADPMGALPSSLRPKAANSRKRGRRGRRRGRNYTPWIPAFQNPAYWTPRYANPGGVVGTITAGMRPRTLTSVMPMVGGVVGNAMLANFAAGLLPGMLQTGIGNLAVSLASAGLLGAGVGMINSRWATPVFLGGVVETVTRAAREYLFPTLGLSGMNCLGCGLGSCAGCGTFSGCSGCGDYGINMMTAPPPGDRSYQRVSGINRQVPSFAQASGLNPYPYGMAGMGDFFTVQDAETRTFPLGAIDNTAASELIALGQS